VLKKWEIETSLRLPWFAATEFSSRNSVKKQLPERVSDVVRNSMH